MTLYCLLCQPNQTSVIVCLPVRRLMHLMHLMPHASVPEPRPRLFIPRTALPYVSAVLERLHDRAESSNVIPRPSDHRPSLTSYAAAVPCQLTRHLTDHHSCACGFLQIRMESHRASGILRQLWLAVWYSLTCRLHYNLSSRVEATWIKMKMGVC